MIIVSATGNCGIVEHFERVLSQVLTEPDALQADPQDIFIECHSSGSRMAGPDGKRLSVIHIGCIEQEGLDDMLPQMLHDRAEFIGRRLKRPDGDIWVAIQTGRASGGWRSDRNA